MTLHTIQQQQLHSRSWGTVTKRLIAEKTGKIMKVIGKVTGDVKLSDLGRKIHFNELVSFSEIEVNRSKELQKAIKRKWVDVVEDRGMILRALDASGSSREPIREINQTPTIDYNKMKEMALEMSKGIAKEMAKEMLKDNQTIKEVVKEMTSEIKKTIEEKTFSNEGQRSSNVKKQVLEEDAPENVFIDVDEKKVKLKESKVGKVKEQKADISKSLNKMKRFKKSKTKKNLK